MEIAPISAQNDHIKAVFLKILSVALIEYKAMDKPMAARINV